MNLNNFELTIQKREDVGSKNARRMRSQGLVPVSFYGGGTVFSGAIELLELERAVKSKTLFNMFSYVALEGKKHLVVAKVLQRDSVTEKILHVDFQIVEPNKVFRMRVPIKYLNAELCTDLKLGGVLNIVKSDVVLSATPENMPACLECNLSKARAKTPIRLNSVVVPAGVSIVYAKLTDTIASIGAARTKEEEVEESAGESKPETSAAK